MEFHLAAHSSNQYTPVSRRDVTCVQICGVCALTSGDACIFTSSSCPNIDVALGISDLEHRNLDSNFREPVLTIQKLKFLTVMPKRGVTANHDLIGAPTLTSIH